MRTLFRPENQIKEVNILKNHSKDLTNAVAVLCVIRVLAVAFLPAEFNLTCAFRCRAQISVAISRTEKCENGSSS